MIKQFNARVHTLYNDTPENTRRADGFATALTVVGLGILLYYLIQIAFGYTLSTPQLALTNLLLPGFILVVSIWLLLSGRLDEAIWVHLGGFWGIILLSMLLGGLDFALISIVLISLSPLYVKKSHLRFVPLLFAGGVLLKSIIDLIVLEGLPISTAQILISIILLQVISALVASGYSDQMRLLLKQFSHPQRNLDIVLGINKIATASHSPREMLASTAEALKQTFYFQDVQIYLFDIENRELTLRADTRGTDRLLEKSSLSSNALLGQTIASKDIVISTQNETDAVTVAVPMVQRTNVVGAINVTSFRQNLLESDLQTLEAIASQLAVILSNSRSTANESYLVESSNALFLATRDISIAQSPHQLIDALRNYVAPTADHISLVSVGFGRYGEPVARVLSSWDRNGLDGDLDFPEEVREVIGHQTLVVQDTTRLSTEESSLREYAKHTLRVNSFVIIPLRGRDRTSGYLITGHYHSHSYTDQDIQILQALAGEIAVVLDNLALLEELSRQTDQLTMVNELSRSIVGTLDVAELGRLVTPALSANNKIQHINLITNYGSDTAELFVFLEQGASRTRAEMAKPSAITTSNTIVEQGIKAKDAIQFSYASEIAEHNPWITDVLNHLIVVPLMARNKQVGLFNIGTSNEHPFTNGDIGLFENIGAQIAVALENINVFQSLEGSLNEATVLYSTSLAMNAAEDLTEIYETALMELAQLSRGKRVSVYLAGPDPHASVEFVEEVAIWDDDALYQPGEPTRYLLNEAPVLSEFPQSRASLFFNQFADDQRP